MSRSISPGPSTRWTTFSHDARRRGGRGDVAMTKPAAPVAEHLPAVPDLERSAAIIAAAGYQPVPLAAPILGVWHLLGMGRYDLVLIHVTSDTEMPAVTPGVVRFRVPPGWPAWTRCLIHH